MEEVRLWRAPSSGGAACCRPRQYCSTWDGTLIDSTATHLWAKQYGIDLVLEDSPAGVRAGRAAGATVIAVTTTHPASALLEADIIVPNLTAIRATPTGLEIPRLAQRMTRSADHLHRGRYRPPR